MSRPPGLVTPIAALSGGNQQKVFLGRLLALTPRALVLNDPMRGVDLGAKQDIYKILEEFASEGGAVMLLSTELAELCLLCDRVAVFHNRALFAVIDRESLERPGAHRGDVRPVRRGKGARHEIQDRLECLLLAGAAGFAILFVGNIVANPIFVSQDNWRPVLLGAAPFIITTWAQTVPILSGNGDLDLRSGRWPDWSTPCSLPRCRTGDHGSGFDDRDRARHRRWRRDCSTVSSSRSCGSSRSSRRWARS